MTDVFKCEQCGCCCKLIGLIKDKLSLENQKIIQAKEDHSCIHLKPIVSEPGKHMCDIYDNRPEICHIDNRPIFETEHACKTIREIVKFRNLMVCQKESSSKE